MKDKSKADYVLDYKLVRVQRSVLKYGKHPLFHGALVPKQRRLLGHDDYLNPNPAS